MKRKILFGLMLAIVVACLCVPAFALTEGDWEFQLLDDEVTITGYLGNAENVVVPETLFGVPVTKIEIDNSEKSLGRAKSVKFPSQLKELKNGVLGYYSKALESAVLPEGLEKIENGVFSDCEELKFINLPAGLKYIGDYAFSNCTGLTAVDLPAGLSFLGDRAFSNTGLVELSWPFMPDLNYSHSDAWNIFADCKKLEKVTLGYGTPGVPGGTFNGCISLKEVNLPNTVTYIDNSLSGGAFEECSALKSIILPTSLKIIESGAFRETGLAEVIIPYGVEEISSGSFAYIPSLKSLYMPDTVKVMASDIIYDSDNCIIYCAKDSYVAETCKKYSISFLTDKSVNSGITVLYNGTRVSFHTYDQNPELINDRTLVPLRAIFEAMDADVFWDDATSTVRAVRDGVVVEIAIGANVMHKNGETIPVDVPAQLINDRTMIPVRVIAEAFGAQVGWNDAGRVVLISE
ncbi:MAG: leucine-rich repeat protein [Clostridia bacterium]|nr:leucine-rich repeat protein [Clostridia bacterium]